MKKRFGVRVGKTWLCGGGEDDSEESELNLQLSGMSMYGAMVRLYGRESGLAPA